MPDANKQTDTNTIKRAAALKKKIEAAGYTAADVLQSLYGLTTLANVLQSSSIEDVERTVEKALAAWAELSQPATAQAPATPSAPATAQAARKAALPVHGVFAEYTTMTGIKLADLPSAMDAEYPRAAYSPVQLAGGQTGTDINTYHVRQRLEQVFGIAGVGWRIVPMPGIGTVDRRQEKRQSKTREYTVWVVTLLMWQFEYVLLTPEPQWFTLSVMTDSAENEDEGYAARGAMSSLIKQALRQLGGFDHFTIGENAAKFKRGTRA